MKIYTKTGDKGETSLFGGKRVAKDDLRIDAYGTVDELNSIIGICRTLNPPKKVDQLLYKIQNQLFTLGADLAAPLSQKLKKEIPRICEDDITFLEKSIDNLETANRTLQAFILPGGSHLAAQIHHARTVCRRAERLVVKLSRKEKIGKHIVVYLNRLSDFLFVLTRWINKNQNFVEIKWNDKK